MSSKTIFIIAFTAVITVFLTINTDAVRFNFIFTEADVSKLLVIGVCTFVGFILGYWAGRPRTTVSSYDDRIDPDQPETDKRLSDEDRDYIN
ncbi:MULTISPECIES: LapA family protein [Pedobacter]|uniref:LapA family protein n=1 Tax=Pedobacter TaxID=84567 RepID=UPI00210D6A02|nr:MULTISPECIES: LapA family protein [unclassified Pedobacter]